MAGLVGGHDGRAWPGLPALLDQITERLIDEGLKLPALAPRQSAEAGEQFRIDLGGEFLPARGGRR
jgi:hypothetical protein